jgi:dTDP-4-dehydrorhamnose 3,5-epimerase
LPFEATSISGVHLFSPQVHQDDRGLFFESFKPAEVLIETGHDFQVTQVNNSLSAKGVIRGLHFKQNPPGQAKFVSVSQGAIVDVVIDLRRTSSTFLEWKAFELSAENNQSLLIANGIGHAFLALEDSTRVSYLCDTVFEPELEHGINPLAANIPWLEIGKPHGISEFLISHKDASAPALRGAGHLIFD